MRVALQRYPALVYHRIASHYKLNMATIRYATPKILALKRLVVLGVHILIKVNQQHVRLLIAKLNEIPLQTMIVRVLITLPVPMVFQSQIMERLRSILHRQIGQASNISRSVVKVKII